MKLPIRICRLLALLLAVYAAAGMCRTGAALAEADRHSEALSLALSETEAELRRLRTPMSDEALRRLAWKRWALVSPEDVVFYDGG